MGDDGRWWMVGERAGSGLIGLSFSHHKPTLCPQGASDPGETGSSPLTSQTPSSRGLTRQQITWRVVGWVLAAALGNVFHERKVNRDLPQENLLMGTGLLKQQEAQAQGVNETDSSHLTCGVGRRGNGWVAGCGSPSC